MGQNKTVLINILSTVLLQGVTIFTAPIFSRILGTNNYGIVSVFNTWATIIVIIFPICVNSTLSMSVNEYDENERKKYQSSIYFLGLVSFSVFSVICLLFIRQVAFWLKEGYLFVILLLLTSLGNFCTEFAINKNTLEFRPHHNLILSLLSLAGNVGLGIPLVYFMREETNYYGKIIAYAVTSLLCGILVSIRIFREGRTLYSSKYWKFCIPLCVPVIFHSLSNTVLSQSDRIMLQNMESNSVTGVYSLAYSFGGVLVSIYSALNNSWIPFYYRYIQENEAEKLKTRAGNYIKLYTIICCGFLLMYPEVFKVFASSNYWSGLQIMPILVASFFLMFLYSLSVNYEFYYKKTRVMAVITVSAAVINILLNYLLIGKSGMIGAAVATFISYLYEFIAHFLYVRIVFKKRYPFQIGFYMKPLLGFMLVNIFFLVFYENYILRWALAMILGVVWILEAWKNKRIF